MLHPIAVWLERHLSLLELERAAEKEETRLLASNCSDALLERKGLALLNLGCASLSIGLGGKRQDKSWFYARHSDDSPCSAWSSSKGLRRIMQM